MSGAQVNYAQQALRHVEAADAAGQPAIVSSGEDGVLKETSWPDLHRKVAALALELKARGVKPGDRVAAYLPNIPETMIAFLATASLGAIWSVCAPDMAAPAVIDRFKQIEPKVLIAFASLSSPVAATDISGPPATAAKFVSAPVSSFRAATGFCPMFVANCSLLDAPCIWARSRWLSL